MMKHYFILIASVLLSDIGCYGQQVKTNDVTVERLHEQVRSLEQTVINLLSKIEEMKTTKSVSTNSVAQNMQKRTPLLPSLQINTADGFTLGDRSANVGDEVGFTFSLMTNADLTVGRKIVFDHKVENIGNAYDANSGEFVCSIPGTYLFALNIVCNQGSYIEAAIEVNSGSPRHILNAVCDHQERPSFDEYGLYCGKTQNGGSAIVKLKQGDKVYVKMIWPLKTVSTVVGEKLSSFSGYLLRPS